MEQVTTKPVRYFGKVLSQEKGVGALSQVPDGTYPIKKYSKAENYLLMTGNHQIDISKRKKDDFLHFLSRWKGG
mgnify:CR=1 FL=1